MIDYEKMSIAELERILAKLKRDLEELEEERMFVLRQTGFHLPGTTVKKYEADVEVAQRYVVELERILEKKRSASQLCGSKEGGTGEG